jgi:hypothetical protein
VCCWSGILFGFRCTGQRHRDTVGQHPVRRRRHVCRNGRFAVWRSSAWFEACLAMYMFPNRILDNVGISCALNNHVCYAYASVCWIVIMCRLVQDSDVDEVPVAKVSGRFVKAFNDDACVHLRVAMFALHMQFQCCVFTAIWLSEHLWNIIILCPCFDESQWELVVHMCVCSKSMSTICVRRVCVCVLTRCSIRFASAAYT